MKGEEKAYIIYHWTRQSERSVSLSIIAWWLTPAVSCHGWSWRKKSHLLLLLLLLLLADINLIGIRVWKLYCRQVVELCISMIASVRTVVCLLPVFCFRNMDYIILLTTYIPICFFPRCKNAQPSILDIPRTTSWPEGWGGRCSAWTEENESRGSQSRVRNNAEVESGQCFNWQVSAWVEWLRNERVDDESGKRF